jgi:hypothetical protein
MNAVGLTEKAGELVGGDRAATHGDKHKNFAVIASYWNAYVAAKNGLPLNGADVGLMMALLKIARTQSGQPNEDDFVDAIGYVACAGEVSSARR